MNQSALTAPDADAIMQLAIETRANLPDQFCTPAMNVLVRVEEFAEEDILRDLELSDPYELTGLYDGIPMTAKSIADTPHQPDVIWLFRRPILDEWIARGDVTLQELVSHVYIHELAHHFGWSDDDISVIDRWWE